MIAFVLTIRQDLSLDDSMKTEYNESQGIVRAESYEENVKASFSRSFAGEAITICIEDTEYFVREVEVSLLSDAVIGYLHHFSSSHGLMYSC